MTGKQKPTAADGTRLLYDIPTAAQQVSLGPSTVDRLVQAGEIESVKVGRRRLIPHDALEDYIARLRNNA